MSESVRKAAASTGVTDAAAVNFAEQSASHADYAQGLNLAGQGSEVRTEDADKVKTIDVPVLRRAAMDSLARREHSYYEISQKLLARFPEADPEMVDAVVARLRAQNLQSDERFTEAYVRYRKSRGFAYLHIKSDLVQRKVPLPIINAYLYEDDADWQEIALRLVERKIGEGSRLEFGSKQHRRLARFLESRGFSQIETRRVLAQKLG